ncbi:hypothetical protein [Altererythrobacter sp. TH136]|uniref:hypothetical protein n=1 Tax=Altererythrobacter sp. TH136 TaxID=2067415 RepID=UPI001164A05F|nr:hypothetical protein [Altererythrobacter sp. TH136]QDM41391.1 hypothetical protein C0V74_10330 [Altererythrobacter sp. TH136]
MNTIQRTIVLGCGLAILTGCGPDDISSPGTTGGVDVVINNPAPPPPPPPPTSATITPAGACPTLTNDGTVGLTDRGTISGPTGSYRVCELPSRIARSVTLPRISGLLYAMNGRVDVGCDGGFSAPSAAAPYTSTTVGCTAPLTADTNVTLTVEPGVIFYARTGQSWLAVNRGNKINAVGTATAPIIFTSQDNVAGLNTDNSIGQWGGVVLLGRGRITDCVTGSVAAGNCERDTEGAVNKASYGGNNDADSSGTMSYVQIRYSGFVLSSDKELQALTPSGIGSGTTLDHIQSHNSSDDGAEFFGGVVKMKHYVATGADDDSLDVDTGSRASIQYALLLQRPGEGDALMEIDSNGNELDQPRTNLKVVNFTAIQPLASNQNNTTGDRASALFRGNADVTLYNGLIISPNNECIRMTSNTDAANDATLTARSVALQCSGTGDAKFIGDGSGSAPFTAAQVRGFITGDASNNEAFVNSLTMTFVNGANENAVNPTDPSGLSTGTVIAAGFFTASPTPYKIGAAFPGNTAWYAGWTCNSAFAPLGGASACTSLPTT